MAVVNVKKKKGYIWIPPNAGAKVKVTVERGDGTVDDVTSILSSFVCEDIVTDGIGNFELEIHDPEETYAHEWTGNEIVRYYKDYDTTATTLKFRGRLEKPNKQGIKLKCTGRSESLFLMNKLVTKSFTTTECSVILKSIFGTYAPDFTLNNVTVTTKTLTVDWYRKPFWDCVRELCNAAGFECYVDADLDVHYFLSGSNLNITEGVVHGYNLMEVEDFTPDISQVRNRIKVSGAVVDGVQIFYTANDTASQTAYGVKEYPVNDDNITSYEQAVDVGTYELSIRKDPPIEGSVKSVMLATINPGDNIWVSSPKHNMPPGTYFTRGYKDEYDMEKGLYTTVYLNNKPRDVSDVIRDRVEQENKKKSTTLNPQDLGYSYNFLFNNDTGTRVGTTISDGALKGVGTWTSEVRILDTNITEAYLLLKGQTLTGATVSVSGNNGVDFQTLTLNTKVNITSATGTTLIVKVVISDATTEVDSLSVQYN